MLPGMGTGCEEKGKAQNRILIIPHPRREGLIQEDGGSEQVLLQLLLSHPFSMPCHQPLTWQCSQMSQAEDSRAGPAAASLGKQKA